MRALGLLLLASCGLPGLTSEEVFGLEPTPRAWVYGVVSDAANGGPLAGATLQIAGSTTPSDSNGAFRLEGQTAGPAELAVSRDGFETYTDLLQLKAGSNRLDLKLQRLSCGTCTGSQVCDPAQSRCVEPASISGDVVNGCTGGVVVARITVGGRSTCAFQLKGYWQLSGLTPGGPQALVAGKEGYQPFRTDVTLVSGFNTLDKISLTPVGGCTAPTPAETPCTCTQPGCQ